MGTSTNSGLGGNILGDILSGISSGISSFFGLGSATQNAASNIKTDIAKTTVDAPAIGKVDAKTQDITSGLGGTGLSDQIAGLREDISKLGQKNFTDYAMDFAKVGIPSFLQYNLGKDELERTKAKDAFAMKNAYITAQNNLRRQRSVKDSFKGKTHDPANDPMDYEAPRPA